MNGKQISIMFEPLGTLGLIITVYSITTKLLDWVQAYKHFHTHFMHVGQIGILSISNFSS